MQQILRSIGCLYFSIMKHLQAPEVMSVQQLSIRFASLFSISNIFLPFFEHKKLSQQSFLLDGRTIHSVPFRRAQLESGIQKKALHYCFIY